MKNVQIFLLVFSLLPTIAFGANTVFSTGSRRTSVDSIPKAMGTLQYDFNSNHYFRAHTFKVDCAVEDVSDDPVVVVPGGGPSVPRVVKQDISCGRDDLNFMGLQSPLSCDSGDITLLPYKVRLTTVMSDGSQESHRLVDLEYEGAVKKTAADDPQVEMASTMREIVAICEKAH